MALNKLKMSREWGLGRLATFSQPMGRFVSAVEGKGRRRRLIKGLQLRIGLISGALPGVVIMVELIPRLAKSRARLAIGSMWPEARKGKKKMLSW